MNEQPEREPFEADEHIRGLLDEWSENFAGVVQSMSGAKPVAHWQVLNGRPVEAGAEQEAELLWWEQPFASLPGAAIWVGAPETTWDYTGSLTLKAAGIEKIEPAEAKSAWLKILAQSFALLTDSLSSLVGQEIACAAGTERAPGPDTEAWASITLQIEAAPLPPILTALSPKLIELISSSSPQSEPESPEFAVEEETAQTGSGAVSGFQNPIESSVDALAATSSRTMDVLLDVDLPVSISFGRTRLAMKDVLKLTMGSIVELDRAVNDPVEVYVNHCLIARGEVVVVDGNYGIRIQQIASRPDRLRSLR
jgi:flagellar motor switch protein FliN